MFELLEQKDEKAAIEMIESGDESLFSCVDEYQSTPLHVACVHGLYDVAKLLIELSPAEIDAIDDNYQTPLHWSAMNGFDNISELLCMFILFLISS